MHFPLRAAMRLAVLVVAALATPLLGVAAADAHELYDGFTDPTVVVTLSNDQTAEAGSSMEDATYVCTGGEGGGVLWGIQDRREMSLDLCAEALWTCAKNMYVNRDGVVWERVGVTFAAGDSYSCWTYPNDGRSVAWAEPPAPPDHGDTATCLHHPAQERDVTFCSAWSRESQSVRDRTVASGRPREAGVMNTTSIRRAASAAVAAALMTAVGGLTTHDAATAYEVSYSAWDSGTNVLLDGAETSAAVGQGIAFTSGVCGHAITTAVQTGVFFPDQGRSVCPTALIDCARDAHSNNRALSGARLFADGHVRCLVR